MDMNQAKNMDDRANEGLIDKIWDKGSEWILPIGLIFYGVIAISSVVFDYIKWNKSPLIEYVWKQEDNLKDFSRGEGLGGDINRLHEIVRYTHKVQELNPTEVIRKPSIYSDMDDKLYEKGVEYEVKIGAKLYLPDINRDGRLGP